MGLKTGTKIKYILNWKKGLNKFENDNICPEQTKKFHVAGYKFLTIKIWEIKKYDFIQWVRNVLMHYTELYRDFWQIKTQLDWINLFSATWWWPVYWSRGSRTMYPVDRRSRIPVNRRDLTYRTCTGISRTWMLKQRNIFSLRISLPITGWSYVGRILPGSGNRSRTWNIMTSIKCLSRSQRYRNISAWRHS